jgi:hypothetical protein
MKIRQFRIHQTETATLGCFVLNDELYYTVELPWKDNKKNVSCIPSGKYTCKRVWSETNENAGYREGFEIMNVPNRTDIIFCHVGNTTRDIQGCSAAGTEINIKGESISHSISAVHSFMTAMVNVNEFELEIVG